MNNLPNIITLSRLFLSVVTFILISYQEYLIGFFVFSFAASTDWLDGYIARKYDQVTTFGRILDPFVDKIIICGTFTFLIAIEHSGVEHWMVVVIVGREMFVTALRGFIEQQGLDFSAGKSGKAKMFLQCFAAGGCLVVLYLFNSEDGCAKWVDQLHFFLLYAAILATIISGVIYLKAATQILKNLKKS